MRVLPSPVANPRCGALRAKVKRYMVPTLSVVLWVVGCTKPVLPPTQPTPSATVVTAATHERTAARRHTTTAHAAQPPSPPLSAATSPATALGKPTPMNSTGSPLVIDVFHDTVCPWCRIGCTNLDVALRRWKGRPVRVRYRPYLLDPTAASAGKDLRKHLGAKFGQQRVDGMFRRVTAIGARAGLHFAFDKITQMPDSALSHALIGAASDVQRRQVLKGIHDTYFEGRGDIGDIETLVKIGVSAGLNADTTRALLTDANTEKQVRALAKAGPQAGVRGVPHFVIGGAGPHAERLGGAQTPELLLAAIERVAAAD